MPYIWLKDLEKHHITISPVVAGENTPEVVAWQVAVVSPSKAFGHYVGRTHSGSTFAAPTLEEAFKALEERLGVKLFHESEQEENMTRDIPVVPPPPRVCRR